MFCCRYRHLIRGNDSYALLLLCPLLCNFKLVIMLRGFVHKYAIAPQFLWLDMMKVCAYSPDLCQAHLPWHCLATDAKNGTFAGS